MLAHHSEVFYRMFFTDCIESADGVLTIDDFSEDVVLALLKFMFDGKTVELKDNVRDLYVLADKYGVLELRNKCGMVLSHSLSLENLEDRIMLAYQLRDAELLKKCFMFGYENFVKFEDFKL